jgi:hypothetical protein
MNNNNFAMNFTPFMTSKKITFYSSLSIPKSFYPEKYNLYRHMLFRNKKNMNTLLLICGNVRTGKSYTGLTIAEQYSEINEKEFDVTTQCSFDLKPFLNWSKNVTDNIYILDEVGNTLNSQEWYTALSKIMRNFIFAQGFRRNILIMILPSNMSLMKSVRPLMNYTIQTVNQGFIKWYKTVTNQLDGKIRYFYMGNTKVSLPAQKTVLEYEKIKKEWNDNQLLQDISFLDNIGGKKYRVPNKKDLDNMANSGLITKEKYISDLGMKGYSKTDAELMYKQAKEF